MCSSPPSSTALSGESFDLLRWQRMGNEQGHERRFPMCNFGGKSLLKNKFCLIYNTFAKMGVRQDG
jgi:hypothetical protein